tara:strand:+ start:1664 stop:2851 length:1188 start_codon:yes stop_codon:yes gene_type:complete
MSAYKQFTTKDIVITPFSANKGFLFQNKAAMTASNVGIEIYFGIQPHSNKLIFEPFPNFTYWTQKSTFSGSQNATGFVNKLNVCSVYSSTMQLYYSNYFGSESGSLIPTASILYGLEGPQNNTFASYNNIDLGLSGSNNIPIGAVKSPQYENYEQSTITQTRTALLGEEIYKPIDSVRNFVTSIVIPSKLWGNNIEPQSFRFNWSSSTLGVNYRIHDDGNGNLKGTDLTGVDPTFQNEYCGNIIYPHGIAILTPISSSIDGSTGTSTGRVLAQVGSYILDRTDGFSTLNINQTASVGFSSSVTLYEHQYKCTVRENEFGYSLNPSLLSGSQAAAPLLGTNYVYKDFATGSYFSPYITTVGLYDNDKNLLAIGKLSVPTKVPMNADLEIQVAFDSN